MDCIPEHTQDAAAYAVPEQNHDNAEEQNNREMSFEGEQARWSFEKEAIEVPASTDLTHNTNERKKRGSKSSGGEVSCEAPTMFLKSQNKQCNENAQSFSDVHRHESHDRRSHDHSRPRGTRTTGEHATDVSYSYHSQPRNQESSPNYRSTSRERGTPYASMFRSRTSPYTHGRTVSAQFDWSAQHLRYASAVVGPRYHSARRAGSVNRFTGLAGDYNMHLFLSGDDTEAIDRMAMHDARRQEAYERAQDIELQRDCEIVAQELTKEEAAHNRWLELQNRQETIRIQRQMQEAERVKQVKARRAELERQRAAQLQEKLKRIDSPTRHSYRSSSYRRSSLHLSQNTSIHEEPLNKCVSVEQRLVNLKKLKDLDREEGSVANGSHLKETPYASARKSNKLAYSAARRSLNSAGPNADQLKIRVNAAPTRAWH